MIPNDPSNLRIVRYPDPVLRLMCKPVGEFGPKLAKLTARMFELMAEEKGIGLAAPQVGVPIRLFVCNHTGEDSDNMICVNPRFLELEGGAEADEGCLSLPSVTVSIRRATRAVMERFDEQGNRHEMHAEDLLARVWLHESDHLEGRLIIDNMSPSDEIANRRAIKQLKEDYASRPKNGARSK